MIDRRSDPAGNAFQSVPRSVSAQRGTGNYVKHLPQDSPRRRQGRWQRATAWLPVRRVGTRDE